MQPQKRCRCKVPLYPDLTTDRVRPTFEYPLADSKPAWVLIYSELTHFYYYYYYY